MTMIPDNLNSLSKDEQIKQLKEIVGKLEAENKSMKDELNDYKDVVQRVRFIIKESQAKYNDQTPLSEIKEAFIEQAVKNG